MKLYEVIERTGPRKTIVVARFTDKDVAAFVASATPDREVREVDVDVSATVAEYQATQASQRVNTILSVLTPEDREALVQQLRAQPL